MSKRSPSPERWAPAPGFPGVEVSSLGKARDASGLLATQRFGGQTVVTIGGKHVALSPLVRSVFPKPKPKKKRGAR